MTDIRLSGFSLPYTTGTTENRPAAPTEGTQYFNTTIGGLQVYVNGHWVTHQKPTDIIAPTGVTATNSGNGRAFNNGRASVAFTPSELGGPVSTYTVTSTPGSYTQTGTSSPVLITGLQSSTSYTYTVTASNSYSSATSSASTAVTATTVPAAPTINSVTNGNLQASIAFTAGATGGSEITGFTVTSSPDGLTASGASSPLVVTGLTNDTAYTFTAVATNANGTSAASLASSSITAASAPNAPTIGTATATGGTTATITFTAPANNGGSTITFYTATSSPAGGTGTLSQSGSGTINITGLTNETSYTFTVTATNALGTSAASSSSNSITPIDQNNWIAILDSSGANEVSQTNTARIPDSSGNIYWAGIKSISGVNGWWVIKYNSVGSIVWAKQISISGFNVQAPWLDLDNSNNLYIIAYGGSSPEKTLIIKLDSNGSFSWGKTFNHSSINSSATHASIRASNGNIALPFYENAAALINSSGGVQWSNRITTGGAIPLPNGAMVSSNNDVYLSALRPNSAQNYYQSALYKLNNGSFGWQRWFTNGTDSAYGYLRAMDSSENLYITGFYSPSYSGNQGILMKVNSSGNVVWQRALQRYTSAPAVDTNHNIYLASYGPSSVPNGANGSFALHKYNSSGTVQWQRTIDLGIGTDISIPNSMSVSADNAYIHFTTTYTKNSVSYPIFFRIPTDGSKTGSYSIKDMTLSYQTVSMTSINGGLTQTTISDSAGSNTLVSADVTQTITSISPTTTKVEL